MSARVSGWVWEHAPVKSGELVVLLALADNAHDDGGGAYPSQATLAAKSRMSDRQVRNCLRALEAAGLIEPQGTTRGGVTIWRVLAGAEKSSGRQPTSGGGGNGLPTEPSKETSGSPSRTPGEKDNGPSLRVVSEAEPERSRGRAREACQDKPMTYSRQRVPAETLEAATRLLTTFNEATGSRLGARKRDGSVSSHLRQIVGAVIDREGEASEEDWHRAIRHTVANPPGWVDGALTLGHVFGAKAADHALANPGVLTFRAGRGGAVPSRFDVAQAGLRELHDRLVAEGR